jgi:hypothetical protein
MQSEKEPSIIEREIKNLRQVHLRFPEKLYADFLIKIRHEDISFRRFFQILIDAFLKDDPRIMQVLDQAIKEERFKYRSEIIRKEREKIMKVSKHFRLNANEIEDIYDIFEGEK